MSDNTELLKSNIKIIRKKNDVFEVYVYQSTRTLLKSIEVKEDCELTIEGAMLESFDEIFKA